MQTRWVRFGAAVAVFTLVVVGSLVGLAAGTSVAAEAEGESELSGQFGVVHDALTGSGVMTTLATRRCPTQVAFHGGRVRSPARVSVQAPAGSTARLVAYAATNGTLLPAPPKWECTASVGADGSEEIGAGPTGSVKGGEFPQLRKGGPSVQATLIPACEGCIASLICSFFPRSSVVKFYAPFQPCDEESRGELRDRLSPSTVLFIDPPGVAGAGTGSGTSMPTLGVVTYKRSTGARQLSCTLPASEVGTCAAAVVAFVDFGRSR